MASTESELKAQSSKDHSTRFKLSALSFQLRDELGNILKFEATLWVTWDRMWGIVKEKALGARFKALARAESNQKRGEACEA